MQIPRRKAGKTLIAEVSRLIGLFNGSKRWASSNPHASSISAITTPETITQIKKQRICQILEQKHEMVETRKARRTDLRVLSYSNKTKTIIRNKRTIRPESIL